LQVFDIHQHRCRAEEAGFESSIPPRPVSKVGRCSKCRADDRSRKGPPGWTTPRYCHPQISTSAPSSMTRSGGIRKKSVDRVAMRLIASRPTRWSRTPGLQLPAAADYLRERLTAGGSWIRTCMGLFLSSRVLVYWRFFVRSGKAVLHPVACDQVRGARGRGQGTETVANLAACRLAASQLLEA
jgi:hypothetical protein